MQDHLASTSSMMLAFRAENVRSFRDAIDFSLMASALSEPDVPRVLPWRKDGRRPVRVLPAAGVFGANASGKSNLLKALHDMSSLVQNSFRMSDRTGKIDREYFKLDPSAIKRPSKYELDLILDGVRHEYGFVIDDTHVLEEWAYRFPHGKAATIFHRKEEKLDLGAGNKPIGRAAEAILRPNVLYLSAAGAAEHPDLFPLYEWFGQNLIMVEASTRAQRWTATAELLANEVSSKYVLSLLHAADLGITDARVRRPDPQMIERFHKAFRILMGREEDSDAGELNFDFAEMGLMLSHRGSQGDVELDVQNESLGTLVWFGIIGPMAAALAAGTVLLVDEIEASLHPTLVSELVRTFQRPYSNPNGAQLIFNSHEATFLGDSSGNRVIGRDQVWFVEKHNDGSSHLYPLTDLNPRKEEAVGRRYLSGRYGATPIVSREEFSEAASKIASVVKSDS
jgi:AAA15 family ATPase/GTPase